MARSLLVIVVAYLVGSIPFGYLIVRASHGADVRNSGSGGTGATNVSRQAGKGAGVLTLFLDALKGAVAVWAARWIIYGTLFDGSDSSLQTSWVIAGAAVAALVGHCFPVWLGFRGGKGVATGLGVFLVIAPTAVAVAAVIFFGIVVLTRYVSLASMAAVASIPLFIWIQALWSGKSPYLAPLLSAAIAGAVLIVFAHRANISRLVSGTESKFK